MTAPTHILTGLALTMGTFYSVNMSYQDHLLEAIVFGALGSLLPDLDKRGSLISELLSPTGIPDWVQARWGHREYFHTLPNGFLVCCLFFPLVFIQMYAAIIALWAGFLSHSVLDIFTKDGSPLGLNPRVRYRWPLDAEATIVVGSPRERVFATGMGLVLVLTNVIAFTGGINHAAYLLTRAPGPAQAEVTRLLAQYEMKAQVRGVWVETGIPIEAEVPIVGLGTQGRGIFIELGDEKIVYEASCGGNLPYVPIRLDFINFTQKIYKPEERSVIPLENQYLSVEDLPVSSFLYCDLDIITPYMPDVRAMLEPRMDVVGISGGVHLSGGKEPRYRVRFLSGELLKNILPLFVIKGSITVYSRPDQEIP